MQEFLIGSALLLICTVTACRLSVLDQKVGVLLSLVTFISIVVLIMPGGVIPMIVTGSLVLVAATSWVNSHPNACNFLR